MTSLLGTSVQRAQPRLVIAFNRNHPAAKRRCLACTRPGMGPLPKLTRHQRAVVTQLSANGGRGEGGIYPEDNINLPLPYENEESLDEEAYQEEEIEEGELEDEENFLGAEGVEEITDQIEGKYPEPPSRSFFLPDLLAESGLFQIATEIDEEYHEVEVYGIQNVAGKVEEGDIYFAYERLEYNGAEHVLEALERKASVIIAEEEIEGLPADATVVYVEDVEQLQAHVASGFYGHPSAQMLMLGVTGSAGKTTVSWLLRGMMEEMGRMTGIVGSLEHAIGEDRLTEDGELWSPNEEDPTLEMDCTQPFQLAPWKGKYEVQSTTPDSLHIQKLLAGMRDRGASAAVVEVEPGEAAAGSMTAVGLDVLVVTNCIKPVGLGDEEEAHQADKEAILALLSNMEDTDRQRAVINLDDPAAQELIAAANVPVVTFSLRDPAADVCAQRLDMETTSTEMIVRTPQGRVQIITSLIGRHNASNVLAAVAAGVAMQLPLASINAGIEAVELVPGRCELVDEQQPFQVLVDAASTPEQLQTLMASVRDTRPQGRIFLLVGADGDTVRGMRPHIGDIAHRMADVVILCNGSPGLEDPEEIVADIVAGFPEEVLQLGANAAYWFLQDQGRVPLWFEPYLQYMQRHVRRYVYEDRNLAIRCAIGTAQPGDFIVLAGQGARDWVEHSDGGTPPSIVRGWFDDRVEVRSALSRLHILEQLDDELVQRSELPWGQTLDKDLWDKPAGIIPRV